MRFTGRVGRTELAALRARAALAIVPSRSAEILPLAAVEAMAAGVPVVAADAGALPEVVAAAGLVAPGDAAALAERVAALWGDAAAASAARGGAGAHGARRGGRRAARRLRRGQTP